MTKSSQAGHAAVSENLRVVLARTRNPLNIGAAARAVSNFGFRHLRLADPFAPAFREARSAVDAGAILEAAEEYPTLASAIADCTLVVGTTSVGPRDPRLAVRSLAEASPLLLEHLRTGRAALLFGSEKTGLSNHEMSYCHWLVRIPTRIEHRSMNLGQAVAICLYELVRERSFAQEDDKESGDAQRDAKERDGDYDQQRYGVSRDDDGEDEERGGGKVGGDEESEHDKGASRHIQPRPRITVSTGDHRLEDAPVPASHAHQPSSEEASTAGRAAAAELDRWTEMLMQALRASGYVKPRTEDATEDKLRRMSRRLALTPQDCELWLGMLQKMLYAMRPRSR